MYSLFFYIFICVYIYMAIDVKNSTNMNEPYNRKSQKMAAINMSREEILCKYIY